MPAEEGWGCQLPGQGGLGRGLLASVPSEADFASPATCHQRLAWEGASWRRDRAS